VVEAYGHSTTDRRITEHRNKVGRAEDGINMNDGTYPSPASHIRMHPPETRLIAGAVIVPFKPPYKRALMFHSILPGPVLERKEELNLGNSQPFKALPIGILLDVNTVMTHRASLPRGGCTNDFALHPANSRHLARSVIECDCRMEYLDVKVRVDGRAVGQINVHAHAVSVWKLLVVEEAADVGSKIDAEVGTQGLDTNGVSPGWRKH
jgi:hypothetical protein